MLTKHLWVSAVALLFVIVGIVPAALAEETIDTRTILLEEDLGTSSTAVDVFRMVCPSGTAKVEAYVRDLSSGSADGVLFTVILMKSGLGRAILRHAPDGGQWSSAASLAQGSGIYFVQIHKNKTTSAKVGYNSIQWCRDSAGNVLTHTSHTIGQDQ